MSHARAQFYIYLCKIIVHTLLCIIIFPYLHIVQNDSVYSLARALFLWQCLLSMAPCPYVKGHRHLLCTLAESSIVWRHQHRLKPFPSHGQWSCFHCFLVPEKPQKISSSVMVSGIYSGNILEAIVLNQRTRARFSSTACMSRSIRNAQRRPGPGNAEVNRTGEGLGCCPRDEPVHKCKWTRHTRSDTDGSNKSGNEAEGKRATDGRGSRLVEWGLLPPRPRPVSASAQPCSGILDSSLGAMLKICPSILLPFCRDKGFSLFSFFTSYTHKSVFFDF